MAKKNNETLDFEQALSKLEDTVKKLESQDIKLDEAMTLFQSGVELVSFCSSKLADVQNRVQKVVEDPAGEVKLTLFNSEEN